MKTSQKLLTAGAICVLSFSLAGAQERPGQAEQQQQSPQAQQQQEQQQQQQYGAREHREQNDHKKASDLRGSEVRSQAGDELGKVQEFAVKLEDGELAFLLVGEEENGEEWTPIPAQGVEMDEENGETRLTVNIDQQRWEQAPKIQEAEIAQLGQEQRARQIYQFFGEDYEARQQELQFGAPDRERQQQQERDQQPGQQQQERPGERAGQQQQQQQHGQQQEFGQQQQERPGERAGQQQQQRGAQLGQQQQQEDGEVRLSGKLTEARILGEQQQQIGEISDFIFNVEEGRVDFVLIEPEDEDGTFAVAPQAFQVIDDDLVHLNASQQDFQQAQELREEQIGQHAQQARMMGAQARQDPQIFRYEDENGAIFGAPGREREDREEKESHR